MTDLAKPLLIEANWLFETRTIDKNEFVAKLKEIERFLEASIHCLSLEFEGSKEANQAKEAGNALRNVKEIIQFVDFL